MAQLEQQQPVTEYKVPRPEDIRAILRNHQQWLDTRSSGSIIGGRGHLKDYDLTGHEFEEFRLEQVVFEHVCMRGRKFENVNLSGCHFVNVDLSGAEFTAVNLSFVQFTQKTDLSDAILTPASLNQTVFDDVVLDNTEFRFRMDSKPEHACQFNDCKGSGTLFTNAKLNHVEFRRNTLEKADFQGAQFTNVRFDDGDYRGCNFSNIKGEPLFMHGVHFSGSTFQGATVPPLSNLIHCVFDDDEAGECSFESAILREVNLKASTFESVNFKHAILDSAMLNVSAVDRSDFTGCSGLYGRHKATLDGVKGAQNARYTYRYDFCTWSLVRRIGSIPLFGVSYFAVIAIILLVSLTKAYNLQVEAFKQKIESTSTPPNNVAIKQDEHAANHDFRSDNAVSADAIPSTPADGKQAPDRRAVSPRWTDKLQEIKLPSTLMRTLGALCLLALGSTVYRVACPHEIQENTLVKWVRELDGPEIEYRALAAKGMPWRWISGVCLSIGALYLLYHIICRVWDAFVFLWSHAS